MQEFPIQSRSGGFCTDTVIGSGCKLLGATSANHQDSSIGEVGRGRGRDEGREKQAEAHAFKYENR